MAINGGILGFGERFWNSIVGRVPALGARLSAKSPLSRISYTDRYLASPLAVRLLFEVVRHVLTASGTADKSCAMHLTTAQLKASHPLPPMKLHHDWQNNVDRVDVVKGLFGDHLRPCQVDIKDKQQLPHARELVLEWADGARMQIGLDHGLGYWRTTWGIRYPFDSLSVEQTVRLRSASFDVEPHNNQCATIIYASEVS